jgi:hypothetical protein
MMAGGAFQPISSQTLLGLVWEYINKPFARKKQGCNTNIEKAKGKLSQV